MKVLSLNIGKAKTVQWKNISTKTAFWKMPVDGALQLSSLTFVGDEQADPRFHGGENKAVYAYDASHYEQWKKVLPRTDWQHGMFGENLTTEGLQDHEVHIGDIFQIGSAKLQVTQPRFPCMKLNIRFNLPSMVKLFTQQKRNGIYFRVVEEGTVKAGDRIELVETSPYDITVSDVVDCYNNRGKDKDLLKKILSIPMLPIPLKKDFEEFIEAPKLF